MNLIYNKEFNCEIQKFKSRILGTPYLYEKKIGEIHKNM